MELKHIIMNIKYQSNSCHLWPYGFNNHKYKLSMQWLENISYLCNDFSFPLKKKNISPFIVIYFSPDNLLLYLEFEPSTDPSSES